MFREAMTGRGVGRFPDAAILHQLALGSTGTAASGIDPDILSNALDEHAIVSIADVKGNITYVNRKFVEISGYGEDELIGQNHRLLKSDEHDNAFYREMWRTIANGRKWNGEVKNWRKNGEPYWVKATIVPVLGDDGKPLRYLSIRTDITETKSAEAFRQQRISFDLNRNEIYMFWPDTLRFLYANHAARQQAAFLQHDLRSLTLADILIGTTEDELRARLEPLVTGGKDSLSFYPDHLAADGTSYPAEITVQLIRPRDEPARFFAVVRDISEKKQAEKAKSQFLATVSHELRTPLTSIKGALGLIKAGAAGDDPAQLANLVEVAAKNAQKLEALINDILDMEKLETGRVLSMMGEVDIALLAEDAVRDFSVAGEEKRLVFETFGLDDPAWVRGDHDRLQQVLANLLSNAVKFSYPGGMIEVELLKDEENVWVSVRDHGVGIADNVKDHIFEKFTQGDSSDQRRAGGTGLGLSLSKGIVEAHGGAIGFTSKPGEGSTFTIRLKHSPDAAAY